LIHNIVVMSAGRLHVVATPIGNLDDITLRALEVLGEADVVAAEDTRHSRTLLARHGLKCRLVALHEHNEERQAQELVRQLQDGCSVALISDAGTPLLSDPGYRLVRLAIENGIEIVAIPGASAVTAALSIAGLPTDRFVFEGFLPPKPAARRSHLQSLRGERRTLVFFESSHRVVAALADFERVFGPGRQMVLCRELTKRFETVLRGTITEVLERVESDDDQRRGEFVLLVAGAPGEANATLDAAVGLAQELKTHVGASQAARIAAGIHGAPRRDIYEALGHDGDSSG
jgi:16S rRNA (cytidine1402-2'-O)-methyltransferase